MIECRNVEVPDFGRAEVCPELSIDIYMARIERTIDAISTIGLDVIVVYADREHYANLSYLTGFDPRFEEALLLLDKNGKRKLLVGNK